MIPGCVYADGGFSPPLLVPPSHIEITGTSSLSAQVCVYVCVPSVGGVVTDRENLA